MSPYATGLVFLIALFLCYPLLQSFGLALLLRFRRPKIQIVTRDELPAYLEEYLSSAVEPLKPLGFLHAVCLRVDEPFSTTPQKNAKLLLYNQELRTFALLQANAFPLLVPGYSVVFQTFFADDTAIMSGSGIPELCVMPPAGATVRPCIAALEAQWKDHQKAVAKKRRTTPVGMSPEEYAQRYEDASALRLRELERQGAFSLVDGGESVLNIISALPFAFRLMRWRRQAKLLAKMQRKTQTPPAAATAIELETDAYERHLATQKYNTLSRGRLTALSCVSIFTFFLFLLPSITWKSGAMLLGLYFLYCAEVLLAMRFFQFKDYGLLLILSPTPFALRVMEKALPAERIALSLLGPLPGLVLGYSVIYAFHRNPPSSTLLEFAIYALLINVFILLPIGGQLLKTLTPRDSVVLRACFPYLVCAVAILLLYRHYRHELFLSALICTLYWAWREIQTTLAVKRAIAQGWDKETDERASLKRIFSLLWKDKKRLDLFHRKMISATAILNRLRKPPTPGGLVIAASFVYLGLLLSPLYMPVVSNIFASSETIRAKMEQRSCQQWKFDIEQAASLEEKWRLQFEAGVRPWEHGLPGSSAKERLRAALALARQIGPADIRVAQSTLALALASNDEVSEEMLGTALRIQETQLKPECPEFVETLMQLAARQAPEAGAKNLERALRIVLSQPMIDLSAQQRILEALVRTVNGLSYKTGAERLEQAVGLVSQRYSFRNNTRNLLFDKITEMAIQAEDFVSADANIIRAFSTSNREETISNICESFPNPEDVTACLILYDRRTDAERHLEKRLSSEQWGIWKSDDPSMLQEQAWIDLKDGQAQKAENLFSKSLAQQRLLALDFLVQKIELSSGLFYYRNLLDAFNETLPRSPLLSDASPSDIPLLLDLAYARLAMGKTVEARQAFSEAQELERRYAAPGWLTTHPGRFTPATPATSFSDQWRQEKEKAREVVRVRFASGAP